MRRPSHPPRPKRPGAVTIVGLLLLLQTVVLFIFGIASLINTSLRFDITVVNIVRELPHALRGIFFIALAWLGAIITFHFLRLRSTAWVSAMLLQGLTLLMALGVYLRGQAPYGYPMMLFGIFMVLYLHNPDVHNAFRFQHPADAPDR